jgi:transcriptional regulator with XRE-family HTH domain
MDLFAWNNGLSGTGVEVQVTSRTHTVGQVQEEGETMAISDRLRALRESKELSQGDIEKRTGLLRCYISRVENGHTVPAVATLEKMASALEVPMYQLFHDGEAAASVRKLKLSKGGEAWGDRGDGADYLSKLRRLLAKMEPDDRKLILHLAQKMARR